MKKLEILQEIWSASEQLSDLYAEVRKDDEKFTLAQIIWSYSDSLKNLYFLLNEIEAI